MKEKKEKFVKQKNSIRKQGKLIIRVLHLSSFFFISTFFSLLATGDYQARQHSLSLSAKGSAREPSEPRALCYKNLNLFSISLVTSPYLIKQPRAAENEKTSVSLSLVKSFA